MSASLGLYRLQQVDRQIDRANQQLDSIRKSLENDAELRGAVEKVETARKESHLAKHALKNCEAETQSQKIKIEQTEATLYGGRIQNPKELQDLQKEAVSLKKHFITLEERELESMLNAEKTENALKDARAQLEIIESRRGGEQTKLLADQSKFLKDLERLDDERLASVTPIEDGLLTTYENLRKQKKGVAVTDFDDGACAACGSTLNASVQQNAKSSQLAYCPTCGRILYAS